MVMNTQQMPFTLVLFGATGDLARRRLLPSLLRFSVMAASPLSGNLLG